MNRCLQLTHFAGFGLLLLVAGCAGGGATTVSGTVPAKGVVLMDGKPLDFASVVLNPASDNQKVGASAVTDKDGKFELKAGNAGTPGALPGKYKLVVSRFVKPDGSVFVMTPESGGPAGSGARDMMPPQYSDPINTTLTLDIPAAGSENLKIELSSTAGPPGVPGAGGPPGGAMPK